MSVDLRRPASDYWRHDPRVDPPTRGDRRRLLLWVMFLGITPLCLGVVVWAAVGLNGSYPTVAAPVPPGWQAVPGVYASFSVPKSWSLQQYMSDAAGDIYYSGPGGSAGESVVQSPNPPSSTKLPQIVGTFLVDPYRVVHRSPHRVANTAAAFEYTFKLSNGSAGIGVLAWAKATQSRIWLVVTPAGPLADGILSTLRVAP